jgi:hypothetical protein
MITPVTVILSFALVLLLLALFKPQAGRIVFGVFFLLMAWGVNVPLLLNDPNLFVAAGAHAYIPFYRWFFTQVLAWNPVPFIVLLILFETGVGLLTLSTGRWAQTGLCLGALFCLGIAWIGVEGLMMPAVAIGPLLMLRSSFPKPVFAPFFSPLMDK